MILMLKKLIIACVVLLWISCSKNGSSSNDNQAPTISIVTPTGNQVFTGSQTIHTTGLMTDHSGIAEIHFHIYNNATSALLIDIHHFPDAVSYNFDESFAIQAGIQYRVEVVGIDKAGNQDMAGVRVSCN
jgi:hypothetical protein